MSDDREEGTDLVPILTAHEEAEWAAVVSAATLMRPPSNDNGRGPASPSPSTNDKSRGAPLAPPVYTGRAPVGCDPALARALRLQLRLGHC